MCSSARTRKIMSNGKAFECPPACCAGEFGNPPPARLRNGGWNVESGAGRVGRWFLSHLVRIKAMQHKHARAERRVSVKTETSRACAPRTACSADRAGSLGERHSGIPFNSHHSPARRRPRQRHHKDEVSRPAGRSTSRRGGAGRDGVLPAPSDNAWLTLERRPRRHGQGRSGGNRACFGLSVSTQTPYYSARNL